MFVASSHHFALVILTSAILQFALVALLVESVEFNGGAARLLYFSLLLNTEAGSLVAKPSLPAGCRTL